MNQEGAGCSQNMNAFLDEDNEGQEEATLVEGEVDDDFEMEENNEEAEQQDEDLDEDEEPPFMDEDEGKLWDFARKIQDGQHLKEWCQTNGGLIAGKENLMTRQFDCPINGCQFKAIFLKRCSMVYTRNEHNHGVENIQQKRRMKVQVKRQAPNVGDDYLDHCGKIWKFQEEIGTKNVQFDDDEILKEIYEKYGLPRTKTYQSTWDLRCQKNRNKGGCKYAGIYVKENGCLYTRGQHEHK